jgi:hypothetical protein
MIHPTIATLRRLRLTGVAGDQNPRELGEITLRATGIGLSR